MNQAKPFSISKQVIWKAYKRVKANKGVAGVDEESIQGFERKLEDNLYKLWNRMSSGSYLPPPVWTVEIPKDKGGMRRLGIPTVTDRIAQMVVKIELEPKIEPYFHQNSYGYRPKKSAHEALEVARERCWRYDWVLDIDIKGFFDNLDHKLLMCAVQRHTDSKWKLLYIGRWLKAPAQLADGTLISRDKGIPQGGVISPLLANLFLHYAFDEWMRKKYPHIPFERYADDVLIHCKTETEARTLKSTIEERLAEVKLQLNHEKTKMVYCKDDNRQGDHPNEQFDFLGYTFRPRQSKNRWGQCFVSFTPAVSNKAAKSMRRTMCDWKLHLRSSQSLEELAKEINPTLRGWINYYGKYYRSALKPVLAPLNHRLAKWAIRKYKRLNRRVRKGRFWLARIAKQEPNLFAHWQIYIRPTAG